MLFFDKKCESYQGLLPCSFRAFDQQIELRILERNRSIGPPESDSVIFVALRQFIQFFKHFSTHNIYQIKNY